MKLRIALVLTIMACTVEAANVASDNATDPAYDNGWQTGDNGGSGFGAWTIATVSSNPDRNGAYVGSSANNGDLAPSGNIDVDGESWGLYANQLLGMSGPDIGVATATRSFTGGELSVGQTLSLRLDTGLVDSWMLGPGSVGFSLNRFSFFWANGASEYQIGYGDPNSTVALYGTGVPLTYNGLELAFTRTAVNEFYLLIKPNGGSEAAVTGELPETGGNLDQITFYNRTAGPDASHDVFLNSMQIGAIPEPSATALAAAGFAALLARRRRKSS